MFGETIIRRRFTDGPVDRYGKPSKVPNDVALEQTAAFDPGGSVEPVEVGRVSTVTSPSLYFTEVPDLTEADEVQVRGLWFRVDGVPAVYVSPFTGVTGGVVVRLERVSG